MWRSDNKPTLHVWRMAKLKYHRQFHNIRTVEGSDCFELSLALRLDRICNHDIDKKTTKILRAVSRGKNVWCVDHQEHKSPKRLIMDCNLMNDLDTPVGVVSDTESKIRAMSNEKGIIPRLKLMAFA